MYHAIYVYNQMAASTLVIQTPQDMLLKSVRNNSKIRVFVMVHMLTGLILLEQVD